MPIHRPHFKFNRIHSEKIAYIRLIKAIARRISDKRRLFVAHSDSKSPPFSPPPTSDHQQFNGNFRCRLDASIWLDCHAKSMQTTNAPRTLGLASSHTNVTLSRANELYNHSVSI